MYCVNLIVFTRFGKSFHVQHYDLNDCVLLEKNELETDRLLVRTTYS